MIDFQQDTLFGKKIISTISFDEQEIIKDILYLHADGNQIELDPTFSIGNFYNKGIPIPKYIFDKYPQSSNVVEASSEALPIDDNNINVIMFDPPFLIGGSNPQESEDGSCIIGKRFTVFKDLGALYDMYSLSIEEFYRILRKNGILIFKCQDTVLSAKNHFIHCWIMAEAKKTGFYPLDLFILMAQNRITDGRVQQHARKFHSYFWVFRKV